MILMRRSDVSINFSDEVPRLSNDSELVRHVETVNDFPHAPSAHLTVPLPPEGRLSFCPQCGQLTTALTVDRIL